MNQSEMSRQLRAAVTTHIEDTELAIEMIRRQQAQLSADLSSLQSRLTAAYRRLRAIESAEPSYTE